MDILDKILQEKKAPKCSCDTCKTPMTEDDPCWKNYKQIGMKKKGGKDVPNCVPKESVTFNDLVHNESKVSNVFKKIKGLTKDQVKALQSIPAAQMQVIAQQLSALVMSESTLTEALSPKDKKVIDAFYDGKDMVGKSVIAKGDKLETTGMGAQVILKKHQGKFRVFAVIDGRRVQEILRYIKKSYPKNTVIEDTSEGKLVSGIQHITDVILKKVSDKIEKTYAKNPESAESMLNSIGAMVKHKVTSQSQEKGKLFLKFGEEVEIQEDAAVDSANLKAKQAEEIERLKDKQEQEVEALQKRHDRDNDKMAGQKEKESANDAIDKKRDADRKANESLGEKFRPDKIKGSERITDFEIQFRGDDKQTEKDWNQAKKIVSAYSKTHKLNIKDANGAPLYSDPRKGSSAFKVGVFAKNNTNDKNHDLRPLVDQLAKLKTAEDHGGGYGKPIKEFNTEALRNLRGIR